MRYKGKKWALVRVAAATGRALYDLRYELAKNRRLNKGQGVTSLGDVVEYLLTRFLARRRPKGVDPTPCPSPISPPVNPRSGDTPQRGPAESAT